MSCCILCRHSSKTNTSSGGPDSYKRDLKSAIYDGFCLLSYLSCNEGWLKGFTNKFYFRCKEITSRLCSRLLQRRVGLETWVWEISWEWHQSSWPETLSRSGVSSSPSSGSGTPAQSWALLHLWPRQHWQIQELQRLEWRPRWDNRSLQACMIYIYQHFLYFRWCRLWWWLPPWSSVSTSSSSSSVSSTSSSASSQSKGQSCYRRIHSSNTAVINTVSSTTKCCHRVSIKIYHWKYEIEECFEGKNHIIYT